MPTYEYVCVKCEHRFEKFQSMNDKALTTCPEALCGQRKWGKGRVKRAISAGAGLIFKGSGFYITDYRSEGYKEAAKKDTAPAATGGEAKSGETKSESKPAAKAETSATTKPAKAKSREK